MTLNLSRRMSGKVIQFDYDVLVATSDQKCCFSLTKRDVQMILVVTEQMHWRTRYLSPSGAEIDEDLIDAWASGLERRIMDGCCPDGTLSRFDGTVYQTSVDNGATWQDAFDQDPRNQGTAAPPLPGSGDNVKCAAADNARDQFLAMRDNLIALLTAGTTVIAIVAGIAGFIGVVLGLSGAATGIGVLLIGTAAALLSLTPEAVASEIDSTALNNFRCILFCHMESNGQLTYAEWQDVLSDIDGTFSGFPHTFFYSIVNSMGYIGLSNAGTMGVATADDCSGCDCACGGETVGTTLVLFHGDEITRNGCNIQATATADGDHNAVTVTWDGTHPWKLTAEGLIPPPSSPSTGTSTWQWYTWDGSEHGPFTASTAPIGVTVTTIELFGTPGNDFSVSWDVATP